MLKLFRNYNYLFTLSIIVGTGFIFLELFIPNTNILDQTKSVAVVNGIHISEDQYLNYASDLGADSINQNESNILELILERMIEEELLLQKGLELQLHTQDVQIRKEIIQQVINFILQLDQVNPTDKELKDYFQKNKNKYLSNDLIQIESIFTYSKDNSIENTILESIRINGFNYTKNKFDENSFFLIPNKLINSKDCSQLLGNKICKKLLKMNIGDITNLMPYEGGFFIFKIINLKKNKTDQDLFNKLYDKIIFDYKNYIDDKNFKDYIQYLKDTSDIKRYKINDQNH